MTALALLGRYAVVAAAAVLATYVLNVVLLLVAGYTLNAGVAVVAVAVPALYVGMVQAKATRAAMDSARMWRLAGLGTLINVALSAMVFAVSALVSGITLAQLAASIDPRAFALILAGSIALYVLVARFCMGFGQRQELRRQEKTAR